MAYIVSVTTSYVAANVSSGVVAFPTHSVGNLLLCCITQDGGGTAITTASTGWAMLGTGAASAGSRQQWAWKVATGTTGENPTFSGANDEWLLEARVVQGASSTPFGASPTSGVDFIRVDYDLTSTQGASASGGLTTAVDNCLLLYSWCLDAGGSVNAALRVSPNEMFTDSSFGNGTAPTVYQITGHRQMGAAGAAPTVTCYSSLRDGGNGWVIAIRNSVGGGLQKDVRAGCTPIKWYGDFGTTLETLTYNVASYLTGDTINGIATSSAACTVGHTIVDASNPPGFSTLITTAENTAGSWQGVSHDITSTNMSGKVFTLQWAAQSLASPVGAEGWIVVFSDGTNWATYRLGYPAQVGLVADIPQRAKIALGVGTAYAVSVGAINWAAVTKIGYFQHRVGSVTTAKTFTIKNAMLFDTAVLIGGNSVNPVQLSYFADSMVSAGLYGLNVLQGAGQVQAICKVQIGDGATPTYFDLSGQAFTFPLEYSAGLLTQQWNAAASAVGLNIKASASDTINLTAGILSAPVMQPLTIDAASSLSATYSFQGLPVYGFDFDDNSGVAQTGTTFKNGTTASFAGNLTNVTVSGTVGAVPAVAISASGKTITSSTIDVTGTAATYHLELGTAVTAITLTDATFTGTPGTDKVHVLKTTGTVTITISGTTSLSAGDVTSEGATVVIAAPLLYQTVTVSGAVAGSRIQIYDTTSSTELYNGTPSFPYTWMDSVAASASRVIRLRVAYQSTITAKNFIDQPIGTCGVTSGTESVSYLVNQTADTTYNSNAVNGSTIANITFVDSGSSDRVDTAIPGGAEYWKNIYAAFVYWSFTATGIANDFTYIDAPDPANYLLSSMKIRNTDVVDLSIFGGYGRDAVSGLSADIIDTAGSTGNIFLCPDHVTPYQTTGTYAITGDISTVLTAVNNVPTDVWADSKALTVGKFLGLK